MGISKLTYGSGEDLFEISYKDDEVITETGDNSYMSDNFEANAFAAFQNKKQTQFFESGPDTTYNGANEHNCIWQKWSSNNKTDLLSGADDPTGYYTLNCLLTDNGSGRRIVTDLTDIQRVVWRPEIMETYVDTHINGTATRVTYYVINTNTNQHYCDIMKKTDPTEYTAQNVPIAPWLLYPQDKTQLQVHYIRHDVLSPWGPSCERYAGVRNTGINNARTYPLSTALIDYDVPVGNNQNFGFYDNSKSYIFHCTLSTNNYATGNVWCYICSEDELKVWLASSGLKFIYKNKMYKPVAEGNIIVGYTDDMTSKSDWDEWHTKDDHAKPDAPPVPRPAPGHWDDILSAGTFGSTLGFVNAYYISRAQLLALKTWMGKDEASGGPPDGYDMLNAIVGIKMYPWALATTAPDDITIVIPGSQSMWTGLAQRLTLGAILEVMQGSSPSGNTPTPIRKVNSGVKGFATKAGMQQYNLGTLDMRQFMNTTYPFLTYDATVELYIPFVGTFTLDTQSVMGRTLRCYLNLDPGTGGVYGYCMCNNTMIASGTGNIGVDVPISSAQMGIYRAQADTLATGRMANGIISGLAIAAGMPAITSAAVGAMYDARGSVDRRGLSQIGFNSALDSLAQGAGRVSTSLAATASNAVTANRSIRQLQQSHGMAMTGSTGGSTVEWCCPWQAYVKIIRPKPHNPGKNYNHAVAVPTYESGNLSSYKGLTVCIDPDVSGLNATTEERNAIAAIMQGGIIV